MPPPSAAPGHIARIDVLRAAAFLFVFVFHFLSYFPGGAAPFNGGNFPDYTGWDFRQLPLLPFYYGWMGVALFFVISGFCVHYSILKLPRGFAARPYFWRRFLRIYPAYIVNVIGCLLLQPWMPSKYFNAGQIVTHILLIHNLFKSTFNGLNWALWSLGVEWQFYLLFPLLLWGRKRIGLPGCLAIALVFNLIAQTFLSVKYPFPGIPVSVDWSFPLVTWCDWILGACLAEAFVEKRPLFPHNTGMLVGSLLLLIAAANFRPLGMQSYLISSVFFAAIMDRYLVSTKPLAWFERLLVPVGLISYSLYLWHQVFIRLVMSYVAHLGLPKATLSEAYIYFPVIALLTFAVAAASYRWLELGVPRLLHQRPSVAKPSEATIG